jgi:hypothetical protein
MIYFFIHIERNEGQTRRNFLITVFFSFQRVYFKGIVRFCKKNADMKNFRRNERWYSRHLRKRSRKLLLQNKTKKNEQRQILLKGLQKQKKSGVSDKKIVRF